MKTESTAPEDGVKIVTDAVLKTAKIAEVITKADEAVAKADQSAAIVKTLQDDVTREGEESANRGAALREEQTKALAELTQSIDRSEASSSVNALAHTVATKTLIEHVQSLGSEIHEVVGDKLKEYAGKDNDRFTAIEKTLKDNQSVHFTPGTGEDPRKNLVPSEAIKTFAADMKNGSRNAQLTDPSGNFGSSTKINADIATITMKDLYGYGPGENVGAFGGVTKAVEGLTNAEFYNQPHLDLSIITAPGHRIFLSDLIRHEQAQTNKTWAGNVNLIFSTTGIPTVPGEIEHPNVGGNPTSILEGDEFPVAVATFQEVNGPMVPLGHRIDQISNWMLQNQPGAEQLLIDQLILGVMQGFTAEILSSSAPFITGILNDPAIRTWSAAVDGAGLSTDLHQLRAAMGAMANLNFIPTVAIVSSDEYTNLELIEDGQGRFLWGNIGEGEARRAWRMTVIDGPWMPDDGLNPQALLLDPEQTLTIYDSSEPLQVRTQDQDSANWNRNARSIQVWQTNGLNIKLPGGITALTFD